MKKLFCILIIIFCSVYIDASADRQINVQAKFSDSLSGKMVSLDLYEQEGKFFTVSTLFPDYAVVSENSSVMPYTGSFSLFSMNRRILTDMQNTYRTLLNNWLCQQPYDSFEGPFSGELFERFSGMIRYEFLLSDFLQYIRTSLTEEGGDYSAYDLSARSFIFYAAGKIQEYTDSIHPVVVMKSFQGGDYYSFSLIVQQETAFTMSADISSGTGSRVIIGYKENGRYCYRDIAVSTDDSSLNITMTLYSGQASSFRAYEKTVPLFRETFVFRDEKQDIYRTEYILEAEKLKNPLVLSGNTVNTGNGSAEFCAKVFIQGYEEYSLEINGQTELLDRPASLSEKKVISTDQDLEMAVIRMEALSGTAAFLADLFPSLPEEYQELMTALLSE